MHKIQLIDSPPLGLPESHITSWRLNQLGDLDNLKTTDVNNLSNSLVRPIGITLIDNFSTRESKPIMPCVFVVGVGGGWEEE